MLIVSCIKMKTILLTIIVTFFSGTLLAETNTSYKDSENWKKYIAKATKYSNWREKVKNCEDPNEMSLFLKDTISLSGGGVSEDNSRFIEMHLISHTQCMVKSINLLSLADRKIIYRKHIQKPNTGGKHKILNSLNNCEVKIEL